MTSVLPEEESNVTRLKQKSQSHTANHGSMGKSGISSHDESRSFLNFSRENLSISTSELEQGFNVKPTARLRCCSRQTLLSCAALLLALSCAGLELWKLRRVLANARDIEAVKRDVETLKHRFLEKDLLDELKAFEEQLYGEGASEEDDVSSNVSSNGNDYDSSYDESPSASSPSSSSADYQPVTFAPDNSHLSTTSSSSRSSSAVVGPSSTTTATATTTTAVTPCTSKDLEDVLAVLRRAEAERGQAFEQSIRERERLLEEEREREQRRLIGEHRVRTSGGAEKTKRHALLAGLSSTRRRDFFTRLKQPLKK